MVELCGVQLLLVLACPNGMRAEVEFDTTIRVYGLYLYPCTCGSDVIVLRNYFSSPWAKEPGDEATSVHPLQLANWWLIVLVASYIALGKAMLSAMR